MKPLDPPEHLADSPLGAAMRGALVLQGIAQDSARDLLVATTHLVDEFVARQAAPGTKAVCDRLEPRGAEPRARLEAAVSCVLPVLTLVRTPPARG
ncbi:MAG: hypothetical protein ACOZQL_22340 [Myxococcota bacterium]